MWALNWFWNNLLPDNEYRIAIVKKIYLELENLPVGDTSVCPQSTRQVLFRAAENWGHHLQLSDLLPFFLCLQGRFTPALLSFFPPEKGLVSRLLPHALQVYLHMLGTNTAPKLTVSQTGELCFSNKTWGRISGVMLLSLSRLVCFVLQVHRCNLLIHTNEAVQVVNGILQICSNSIVQIPRHFLSLYCDQALLLLVTGALRQIILHPTLSPIIPILCTFQQSQ
ncbi:uncharacterized protein LOC129182608 [Dunckerocampus dactyliophorus]|uniref:uncharacterized protein LOC129182608 n=1 Tax=Dunckerocampus dactyliophorus TaxID=161453 RepID=UPI0024069F44|nr:uncharacterized protein LOC129182608 [Dunckerocampus dactyliophorus]